MAYLLRSSTNTLVNTEYYIIALGFGQVTSRSHSTSSSNLQFRVAEINREDCLDDRQQLFREAAATSNKTNMTPYKSTSVLNGHATPVKPGTTMTPNNKNNR